MPLNLQLLAV